MFSSVDDVLCVSDPDNPIDYVWNMAAFGHNTIKQCIIATVYTENVNCIEVSIDSMNIISSYYDFFYA